MSEEEQTESALFPERVGDRLRTARAKAGLDLSDVATKTRIPLRHLEAIEGGDYSALPSATYCIGFVKSYARCVGENEADLARALRIELGQRPPEDRYEPDFVEDDLSGPIPSRTLVLTALAILALLTAGYFVLTNMSRSPDAPSAVTAEGGDAAEAVENEDGNSSATAAPSANPNGEVVLTAKDAVWLRIYDANDKVLFEKEMAKGERFAVPGDANKPMIRTGRADLIGVTVGGKEVAALGPAERTIKDVEISGKALTARAPEPVAASTAATAPVNAVPVNTAPAGQ